MYTESINKNESKFLNFNIPFSTIKIILLCFFIIFFMVGYFAINYFNETRNVFYNVSFPFEKDIPFVPSCIFAYNLVYVLLAIEYFAINDKQEFYRLGIAFFTVLVIGFSIFLLFPVKMHFRPNLPLSGGIVAETVNFYFWLDKPYNLFPSLHVAISFLAAFFCQRQGKWLGIITFTFAIMVSIAVILVKQHFIMDVVSGFLLAYLGFLFATSKKIKFFKKKD